MFQIEKKNKKQDKTHEKDLNKTEKRDSLINNSK